MSKLSFKTGDEVKILTGSDKGKTGKVTQVFPKLGRVAVAGVNLRKRHVRSRRPGDAGQIIEFTMPIHASNVQRVEAAAAPQDEAAKKPAKKKAVRKN